MKNALFIIVASILLVSCSTNRCIESYLGKELSNNKEKNIISVLTDKKLKVSNTLNIYIGRKKGNWSTQAKSFNQKDYDLLNNQFKNDTIAEYWSKTESKNFKFTTIVKNEEISKYRDSINSDNDKSEVHNYYLSKPIFLQNKELALFSVLVTKNPNTIIDDCIIIMKKENGKWFFLEKVNSPSLH